MGWYMVPWHFLFPVRPSSKKNHTQLCPSQRKPMEHCDNLPRTITNLMWVCEETWPKSSSTKSHWFFLFFLKSCTNLQEIVTVSIVQWSTIRSFIHIHLIQRSDTGVPRRIEYVRVNMYTHTHTHKENKIHGSWEKCLRTCFRTSVEVKRDRWAG
jgi:hypothetical protein